MQWFVERYVHFKEIASRWWIVVVGLWSAFWAIDSMMTKWASPTLKATWDENTSHVPRGWQYWLIGLLVITIILVLDGSFRHAKRFDASNVLEEHDPKVYFEPVNSDFIPTGMIPFDMFNNGQRVNPAHRITVQPIALLPSVTFEYVNHLEMNQHKKLLPQVKHGPDSLLDSHNILPALETAWLQQNADEANGELPFEIMVSYQDAAGRKTFETKVSLVYSAKEHVAAGVDVLAAASSRREFKIIKIVNMEFRRLS